MPCPDRRGNQLARGDADGARLPGWWQDLTSPEFARLDPEATVAVLPVGAIEQHGPHLPVAVDACLIEAIVAAAWR